MATAKKLLELARGEIGVKENPAGSNKVKYCDEYGGSPSAWCCKFIWWLFKTANASNLFYGGKKTAYCPTLQDYHRKARQTVTGDYQPGDIIFFDFNGNNKPDHVGICESWNGTYITTIDGNTGEGNEANGGAVMRRTRHAKYICGAYRPAYDVETTKDTPSEWADFAWNKAFELGLLDGTRPQDPLTREEFAVVLMKVLNLSSAF